jgi:hypothetical protein
MMEKAKELIVTELSAAAAMPLPQIERKIAQALSNGFKDIKAGLEA